MTMHYLDIAVPDLQREFHRAQTQPRHLVPQPKISGPSVRDGIDGIIQSILASQHLLEMFRRSLSDDAPRRQLGRLSNRLTKILAALRCLAPPTKRAEIGRLCRARHIRPYAEFRIMPSAAGERQRGRRRVWGVLGIIRAPTRRPEVRRLA
jgi:hypothetical protein